MPRRQTGRGEVDLPWPLTPGPPHKGQPISCFPQVVSASGKHTKRPPRVQNRGSNKSAWDWATGLQCSPVPAPYFYSSTPLRESWHDPGLRIIHIYLGAPSVYAVSQTSRAPILSRPPCLQDSFPLTYHSQTEDLNSRWWSSCATSLRWPQFIYHRRRNMYETECLWQADACVLGSRERLVYWYKPSTGHWKRRPYKRIQSGVYTIPEPHDVALVIDILGNCFPSDIANTSSICC